jgi:hypothetical protein
MALTACHAVICHQLVIQRTVLPLCQLERLGAGSGVEGWRAIHSKGGIMADMDGSEAAGTQQAVQVEEKRFLSPDSALVRTALDLLSTHAVDGTEGEPALCGHCGMYYPCPTVQHARQVVNAGGVARAADGDQTGEAETEAGSRDPVGAAQG